MQGYPMPRPPQALIDAERAMQSTPEYQALTAYHRSISTGQGLTQDQEQELQKLNNAFQQTDAFKKRAEMAGGQVGNALRNGIPGNPGFPANSGYPTMQGYPGVPFSGTSGTPGTFASEPMRGSPGMFGGGPMGMGPMVGGVPSQIGGQDIRNLIGGQPQQPQPPAGLSAALQQANPAMSGLSNVFGRGMFKDGGAVKARAKKKGV
jgi:hypothetical protein